MTTQNSFAASFDAASSAPSTIMSYGKEIRLPKDMKPDDFVSLDLMEVGERMSLIDFADTYGFDSISIKLKSKDPEAFENHKYDRLFYISIWSSKIKSLYDGKEVTYGVNLMPGVTSGMDEDIEEMMIDFDKQLRKTRKLDAVEDADRISVIKTVNNAGGEQVIKLSFSNAFRIH